MNGINRLEEIGLEEPGASAGLHPEINMEGAINIEQATILAAKATLEAEFQVSPSFVDERVAQIMQASSVDEETAITMLAAELRSNDTPNDSIKAY